MRRRKCRALCPWSDTASPFADGLYKLCNRMEGHAGAHRSLNKVCWTADAISLPPTNLFGYDDQPRPVLMKEPKVH